MPKEILNVSKLVAGYGEIKVLHGVSLNVMKGEVVAIIGANGAGKSTLLNTIMGIVSVKTGEIYLEERNIVNLRSPQIAKLGVAIVPEGREVLPSLTVEENLTIGAWTNLSKEISKVYEESYDLFPKLKDRRNQRAGTLSGGEQQMLAVARALMSDPKILLIDEPSMGLAPMLVQDLYEKLAKINQLGTTILLVEQNVKMALNFCHRGYVMERGKIMYKGSGEELKKERGVIDAYLGIASD